MPDDMTDCILAIYVRVQAGLLLSVVVLVAAVLSFPFCELVGVCRAGYHIYTDDVLGSVVHDAIDFGSNTYKSV